MYVKVANKDIEDSIKSEMSGDLEAGMLAIGTKKCWPRVNFIQFNLKNFTWENISCFDFFRVKFKLDKIGSI